MMGGMQRTNHDTVPVIYLHMQRCERDRSPHQGVVGVRAGEVRHQPRFVRVPNLVMVVRMSAWVACVQRVYVITVDISPWSYVLRVCCVSCGMKHVLSSCRRCHDCDHT